MKEDPANDPGPAPRYRWRETWPGEGHRDYQAWDGTRAFGRIYHEDQGPTKDLWRWAISHIDGVKQVIQPHNGYEKSARLAAEQVENLYERLCALNDLEIHTRRP